MCINPTLLPNNVEVACRKCWQCRENRINDWVGRCIAETKSAVATHSITLTYGRDDQGSEDHVRAKLLTYSDVQKYFKRLRKDGFPLRYFAVGEYGTMKARAHWHILIFWQERIPDHEIGTRFEEPHWLHGFSHWEPPSPASIRYVCKYLLKDQRRDGDERQGHLAMSKKPPLGAAYFEQLAQQYVENRLAPQSLEYSFPEAVDKRGRKIRFRMSGKTADNFLRAFRDRWWQAYGDHIPNSELVEAWEDGQVPDDMELRLEPYRKAVRRPGSADLRWFMQRDRVRFSELHNAYYYDHEGGQGRWWWCLNNEGNPEWQSALGGVAFPNPPGVRAAEYRAAADGE